MGIRRPSTTGRLVIRAKALAYSYCYNREDEPLPRDLLEEVSAGWAVMHSMTGLLSVMRVQWI